jgi:hypothetical protein
VSFQPVESSAAVAAEARFGELCRRHLALLHFQPAPHSPCVLIAVHGSDEDLLWPIPPEIDSSAALASYLAAHSIDVQELDPELISLALPLGEPSTPDEFELRPAAAGDYDLVVLSLGCHAHVASFAATSDSVGLSGWHDLNGYLPGLAARLRGCYIGGPRALPADSFEWAFAECAARDSHELSLLCQAAAAESAFRAGKQPRDLLAAALEGLPGPDGYARLAAEAAELAARFSTRQSELSLDSLDEDLAGRGTPEIDQLVFACLLSLSLREECSPAETVAEALAQAPSTRVWQRELCPRLARLAR